jgi:Flp pilus assembly protein TadG
MLMPAAVLVFLVLGALCVDFGSVYVAKRELSNAAAAAANDAATKAIDIDLYYATGKVRLLPDRAREVAEQSVAAKGLDHLSATVADVQVDAAGTAVIVTVRGRARYLFAQAVPNGTDGTDVTASSEAEATELP